ncbi:MAG: hypothetical protein DCC88_05470 [Spirobacillus cienkowskii]|jgi:hypothetical protein|uniref:Uncharacterized protein n=1 Tax=Spirobacillus cienkowskii TaxID=495820 RepID=A0A369KRV5_9BACT|nr:MAG: hypothetical protein DCC88_05470 [Spirobacillus cienkowskii]
MKKNFFKIIVIISFFILFNSCISMKIKKELVRVDSKDKILDIINQIQNKCFSSKNPQFFADFIIDGKEKFSLQMEGVWKNNYNTFKSTAIGPLGEDYLSFELNGYDINYLTEQNTVYSHQSFEKISSFLSGLGSKGLRNIFCGRLPFQFVSEEDGIFYVKDKEDKNDKKEILNKKEAESLLSNKTVNLPNIINKSYFSRSTINLLDREVYVNSYISVTKNNNGYGIIANSRFYYGPFVKDSDLELKWVGFVNSDVVVPTSVMFRTTYDIFIIDIHEYF